MNLSIKKRSYLVAHFEETLDLLNYYKSWAHHIRDRQGLVVWKAEEQEGCVRLNEIAE